MKCPNALQGKPSVGESRIMDRLGFPEVRNHSTVESTRRIAAYRSPYTIFGDHMPFHADGMIYPEQYALRCDLTYGVQLLICCDTNSEVSATSEATMCHVLF